MNKVEPYQINEYEHSPSYNVRHGLDVRENNTTRTSVSLTSYTGYMPRAVLGADYFFLLWFLVDNYMQEILIYWSTGI